MPFNKKISTAGRLNCIVLLFFFCTQITAQTLQRFEYKEQHMGTSFKLIFYTSDQQFADSIAKLAFKRIEELNQIMSDYLPESEVNKLSANSGIGQAQPVSKDLYSILKKAKKWSKKTDGSFDVTIGPLSKLWRRAFRQQQFPDSASVKNNLGLISYKQLNINFFSKKIKLKKQGMRIDLGGIAKGYAIDEAMKIFKKNGINSALVEGGGDILLSAPPFGEKGWKISFPNEKGFLILSNQAIATSGDTYQFLEWNNQRYSHIINPKTGYGITDQKTVTVIANNCTDADVLASVLSLVSKEEIKGWKKSWEVFQY